MEKEFPNADIFITAKHRETKLGPNERPINNLKCYENINNEKWVENTHTQDEILTMINQGRKVFTLYTNDQLRGSFISEQVTKREVKSPFGKTITFIDTQEGRGPNKNLSELPEL